MCIIQKYIENNDCALDSAGMLNSGKDLCILGIGFKNWLFTEKTVWRVPYSQEYSWILKMGNKLDWQGESDQFMSISQEWSFYVKYNIRANTIFVYISKLSVVDINHSHQVIEQWMAYAMSCLLDTPWTRPTTLLSALYMQICRFVMDIAMYTQVEEGISVTVIPFVSCFSVTFYFEWINIARRMRN